MIARGFKSVIWVAAVGGAALGCYMVSLRVATERNELAKVERQIVAAKRDIRGLQTELGTRGRMTQLEHWNAQVLALAAPSSAQYMKDEFTLARLDRPQETVEDATAEVRLASADTGAAAEAPAKPAAPALVQAVAERPAAAPRLVQASFSTSRPEAQAKRTLTEPVQTAKKPERKPSAKAEEKPVAVAARTTPAAKPAAKTAAPAGETRTSKTAKKLDARKPAAPAAGKLTQQAGAAPRAEKGKASGGN